MKPLSALGNEKEICLQTAMIYQLSIYVKGNHKVSKIYFKSIVHWISSDLKVDTFKILLLKFWIYASKKRKQEMEGEKIYIAGSITPLILTRLAAYLFSVCDTTKANEFLCPIIRCALQNVIIPSRHLDIVSCNKVHECKSRK